MTAANATGRPVSAGGTGLAGPEVAVAAFLHRWGMVPEGEVRDRLLRTGIGGSVARCFPAADADGKRIITEAFTWFTAFDDLHEPGTGPGAADTAAAIAGLVAVLDLDGAGESPAGCGTGQGAAVAAFAAVSAELRRRLTPAQFGRLADAVRGYLLAVLWEHSARDVRAADYLAMRRHLSFARLLPPLLEWTTGRELPAGLHDAPVTRRLLTEFCDVVLIHNDLVSFAWEQAHRGRAEDLSNLITITARDTGRPNAEAAAVVRTMLDTALDRYRVRRAAVAVGAPQAGAYLGALDDFLAGLLSNGLPGRYGTGPAPRAPLSGDDGRHA
ncbi:hypothetical protein [Kitasatospora sp. NPDC088351]|uniref:terpene synthase family protein n=1 Tax=Kitasatospora sp. NPDC088351 TaxID=3155180 RepID=UPI00342E39AF